MSSECSRAQNLAILVPNHGTAAPALSCPLPGRASGSSCTPGPPMSRGVTLWAGCSGGTESQDRLRWLGAGAACGAVTCPANRPNLPSGPVEEMGGSPGWGSLLNTVDTEFTFTKTQLSICCSVNWLKECGTHGNTCRPCPHRPQESLRVGPWGRVSLSAPAPGREPGAQESHG